MLGKFSPYYLEVLDVEAPCHWNVPEGFRWPSAWRKEHAGWRSATSRHSVIVWTPTDGKVTPGKRISGGSLEFSDPQMPPSLPKFYGYCFLSEGKARGYMRLKEDRGSGIEERWWQREGECRPMRQVAACGHPTHVWVDGLAQLRGWLRARAGEP